MSLDKTGFYIFLGSCIKKIYTRFPGYLVAGMLMILFFYSIRDLFISFEIGGF